jgi:uncharacterized protein YecT (DUF1311 family)
MRIHSLEAPETREPGIASTTVELIGRYLTEVRPKVLWANRPKPVPGSGQIRAMRFGIGCIACVLMCAPASVVRAAEDCDLPNTSQADLNDCYGNSYKASDAQLNTLYKQIEGRLKDDVATTKLLVAAQRAWLAFRDAECDFSTSPASGGTIRPMLDAICLERLTSKRIDDFKTYLKCQEGELDCPVPAQPAAAQVTNPDPAGIVTAIYQRAANGKGDSGGQFLWADKAARPKFFSNAMVALWAQAEAKTEGDGGPIDFDPVTNSQDPDIKSFKVTTEKQTAATATASATMLDRDGPRKFSADETVHYDFVWEDGQWKIDDIRGEMEGTPWSVRQMLVRSSKP